MSSKAEQHINILMTKILTSKFCAQEVSDHEACVAHYVIPNPEHSVVDQVLYKRGLAQCAGYKDLYEKCIQDEKKQTAIARKAAGMPQCREEQSNLQKCHRLHPNDNSACERQTHQLMLCGLVEMVQKFSRRNAGRASQSEE